MNLDNIEQRLLRNSTLDEVTGCWNWTGKTNNSGYGQLTVRVPGKRSPVNFYAHRLALVVFTGVKLRSDCHVDHKCRNETCINPEHLRQVKIKTNLSRRRYAKGTAHHCARCGGAHGVGAPCII
jgi:hypothetical protein